jgi:hypothetical protein
MTLDDLISYFVANENMSIQGKKMQEMALAMKGTDLALKAREVPRYEEEDDDDGDQGEVADIGDLAQDLILFAKKYGLGSIRRGRFSSNKSRVKGDSRLCYNCIEAGHLAGLCPYEKREDRLKPNPLNMRRDKPQDGRAKLRPNPLNMRRDKPQDGRAFLGATYASDDEEDEDKVVGMASLALASSDSHQD